MGGRGYRLGRILSCYEKVYWYSHPDNGWYPWTFATTNVIKEIDFSKYHYDRILPDDTYLPLIGSRIEKYWDNEDWLDNWHELMAKINLPAGYLTYVVHDSPAYLRKRFPKSIIFNLIGDPSKATDHHMNTSANFRIDYLLENQIPSYRSNWVRVRDELLLINPDAREKDLWLYKYGGTVNDYRQSVLESNMCANQRNLDEQSFSNVTVSLDSFDPVAYENILGKIHERYITLLSD